MFAAIAQFTRACAPADQPPPAQPRAMTRAEVEFVARVGIEELGELLCTVMSAEAARIVLHRAVGEIAVRPLPATEAALLGEQADALGDVVYFMGDAAAKAGIWLDPVVALIHEANMAKCVDGRVVRRADGKILKPAGWTPPDVEAEMQRQLQGTTDYPTNLPRGPVFD